MQRPWHHRCYLVEQETSRRRTIEAPNHPPTTPLNPLTEIVWVENKVEESVLGHHVNFINALCTGLVSLFKSLLLLLLLVPRSCSPDFT